MRFRSIAWLGVLLCCINCGPRNMTHTPAGDSAGDANTNHWAIYYDYRIPIAQFQHFDLVVFDRVYYPDFTKIHRKTVVLAEVNAGEVPPNTPDHSLLEHENALLAGGASKGMAAVDLTSPRWHQAIMTKVDDAINKGFDGVMLDGLDSPLKAADAISTEVANKNRDAAITLIEEIRNKHPKIKIMLNRAFDILPQVASKIDYVLAESILTENDDFSGHSRFVAANTYQQMAGSLRWARDLSSDIKIYTLDYWNVNDGESIKKIYRMQREQGFSPYVTSRDLRHFTPEPQ